MPRHLALWLGILAEILLGVANYLLALNARQYGVLALLVVLGAAILRVFVRAESGVTITSGGDVEIRNSKGIMQPNSRIAAAGNVRIINSDISRPRLLDPLTGIAFLLMIAVAVVGWWVPKILAQGP